MNKHAGFTTFEFIFALAIGTVMATGVAGLFVAVHFVSKFW